MIYAAAIPSTLVAKQALRVRSPKFDIRVDKNTLVAYVVKIEIVYISPGWTKEQVLGRERQTTQTKMINSETNIWGLIL